MLLSNKEAIYLQIYHQYKTFIKKGIFKYEEKLLSVRELALSLGINPNTVSRAYQMLEEENYIKSIPKKGYYVSYIQKKNKDDPIIEQIKIWLSMGICKEVIIAKIKTIDEEKNND